MVLPSQGRDRMRGDKGNYVARSTVLGRAWQAPLWVKGPGGGTLELGRGGGLLKDWKGWVGLVGPGCCGGKSWSTSKDQHRGQDPEGKCSQRSPPV